jgi:hypothetical protein
MDGRMRAKLLLPAFAVLALGACDGNSVGPAADAALSAAESETLATVFGDQNGGFLDGFGGPSFSIAPEGPRLATTVTTNFTRTRTCPQGGSVKLEGTHVLTTDPATRTGSSQFNATRTESACAVGREGVVITVNGNPNTVLTANQSWSNGTPGVRTATAKGSFTWSTSTGRTGTCTIDVTHTWTPATHTLHVVGQVCNRTVDVTRTWTQS